MGSRAFTSDRAQTVVGYLNTFNKGSKAPKSAVHHTVNAADRAKTMATGAAHVGGYHGKEPDGKKKPHDPLGDRLKAAHGAIEMAEPTLELAHAAGERANPASKLTKGLGKASKFAAVAGAGVGAASAFHDGYKDASARSGWGKTLNGAMHAGIDEMVRRNGLISLADAAIGVVAPGHKFSDGLKDGANAISAATEMLGTGTLGAVNDLDKKMAKDTGVMPYLYNASKYTADQGFSSVYGDFGRAGRQGWSTAKAATGEFAGEVGRTARQVWASGSTAARDVAGEAGRTARQVWADGSTAAKDFAGEAGRTAKQVWADSGPGKAVGQHQQTVREQGGVSGVTSELWRTMRQIGSGWGGPKRNP
ncbi:MAG: hypothetical protein FJ100_06215 [Deltaproteobacteria bacterium]|nr:hypothetical protein [Deltaproteobacteria bacterium]